MQIFVVGYPSGMGGADTELWHVLKLWRAHDVDVTLIPTWHPPYGWQKKCDAVGVETRLVSGPEEIPEIAGLSGSVVVSFCNGEFLQHAAVFRGLGCRIAWVGCMTWPFDAELAHYADYGPFDAYVFQSEYQRETLFPRLAEYGVTQEQCHLIRGAFDPDEFPFRPRVHDRDEEFVIGRLSRADGHKWYADTWDTYAAIPFRPLRARVMAWEDRLKRVVGPPPSWVETLSGGDETAHGFLKSLHCLVQLSGLATENWPRVGLEAMATGVPIVTDARGGWLEMIEHGTTGFLAAAPQEVADYAGRMATREHLRMETLLAARTRLVRELANPEEIMASWRRLFKNLSENR